MVDDDWSEGYPNRNSPSDKLRISSKGVDDVGIRFRRGNDGADNMAPEVRKNKECGSGCPEAGPQDGKPDRPPDLG